LGFTIETTLKELALDELAANHRRRSPSRYISDEMIREGAEKLLMQTLGMIVRQIEQHGPRAKPTVEPVTFSKLLDRDDLSPSMRARIEESRSRVDDSSGERQKMLDESFRRGLIKLLTMDDGVSQTTAEHVVDHLLAQRH
jgi:hypothetical protein